MLNCESSIDEVLRGLADPTRRAIVERLGHGAATVSELARPFAMSLPAIVQHVQLLEQCGLVRTAKSGRVRTCHVEPQALRLLDNWISQRRALWERRFDRLGEVLAGTQPPIQKKESP